MVAISGTSEPACASLVTAVPRRSRKVMSSCTQPDQNPSSAHAVPLVVVSRTVAFRGVPSS
jgi:hypothetical protein